MPHLPPKKMAGCPFGQATHLQVRLIRGPGAPSLGTRCCMCFLSGQKMSSGRWNIFGAPKKVPKVHPIPIPNMYMNIWIYIYICIIYNYILYIYIYDVIYTTSYFFSWKLLCFTVSPSGQTHTEGRWVPDILLWIHVQTLRTSNVSCISSHLGWFYRASGSCPPSSSNRHCSAQCTLHPYRIRWLPQDSCAVLADVHVANPWPWTMPFTSIYLISNNVLGISNLSMMSSTLPDIIWYCMNLYHMTWQWSDSDTIRNGAAACGIMPGSVLLCRFGPVVADLKSPAQEIQEEINNWRTSATANKQTF